MVRASMVRANMGAGVGAWVGGSRCKAYSSAPLLLIVVLIGTGMGRGRGTGKGRVSTCWFLFLIQKQWHLYLNTQRPPTAD